MHKISHSVRLGGFLTFLICSSFALGQQLQKPDSLAPTHADSLALEDTLRIRFIPAIGSLRQEIDSTSAFHSSRLTWTNARYFGNAFQFLPGFFLRDLGEPAKPGQFNAWGMDWRGVSILLDGRPMNDPITGTYNLYDIPMEFVEQVEDFPGIASFGESWNAPGSTLNFVTHQYNTLRPITKIRYVQSPFNNLMTDGLFSQNLLRGLNLMFGFQRQVSDGRFNGARQYEGSPVPAGALVDNWNVRTRLRYNASDRLNIALTDFYTKDINGLNGGVLPYDPSAPVPFTPQNVFNEVGAFVNSPNAVETVSRHDDALQAIAKLFDDSATITQATVYYTRLDRDFKNPGNEFNPLKISDSHYAELSGIRIQQSFRTGVHTTEVGLQSERSQYASHGLFDSTASQEAVNNGKRTMSSGFLTSSIHPVDFATVSLSGRYDELNGESAPSAGIGLKVTPASMVSVFADAGQNYRFPTFQESSWADSTIFRPSPVVKEKHTLVRIGVEMRLAQVGVLSITGFDRNVDNPIVFRAGETSHGSPAVTITNIPSTRTRGIVGTLNGQYGPFDLHANLLYTTYKEGDTTKLLTPNLVGSAEVSYQHKFFNDALDAKIGARVEGMSDQRGTTINQRFMLYTENATGDIPAWSQLDLYAILKIGDAYITLSYENVLNAAYYIVPIYPMPGPTFRFGVNWAFLD